MGPRTAIRKGIAVKVVQWRAMWAKQDSEERYDRFRTMILNYMQPHVSIGIVGVVFHDAFDGELIWADREIACWLCGR
jgi:hypothetical protein